MQPDSVRVERFFQRSAVDFDSLYHQQNMWRNLVNRWLRRGLFERIRLTLGQFPDAPQFDVLDVGCGSGRNSVTFAQAGARKVVGIDFAEDMLELARRTSHEHGMDGRCEFIKGNVLTYPFTRKFDVVVALGVFDYEAEPEKLMRRMMQLSSGKVIASFPALSPLRAPLRKIRYALRNCPLYFYTRGHLEQMCAACGLHDYDILPYASSGYMVVGRVGV